MRIKCQVQNPYLGFLPPPTARHPPRTNNGIILSFIFLNFILLCSYLLTQFLQAHPVIPIQTIFHSPLVIPKSSFQKIYRTQHDDVSLVNFHLVLFIQLLSIVFIKLTNTIESSAITIIKMVFVGQIQSIIRSTK